jgi:aspartyl-tRNA synthetase
MKMRSGSFKEEEKVEIGGWVDRIRDLGSLKFILVRDVEGILQVTLSPKSVSSRLLRLASNISKDSVIRIKGVVKADARAPDGVEIVPSEIEIVSKADQPLPLDSSGKIESGLDVSLDWRCIDLRQTSKQAIFKIQASLVSGMRGYLNREGFLEVFTPCLMGSASESGAEVFSVLYFNKQAFLRQDPQLHRQLTIASGFERIYDLGPSFRADPSHTPRHICEYRSCCPEIAWIDDERDTMKVESEMIVHAMNHVVRECQDELALLKIDLNVPKLPFPELRFPEIYSILEEIGKKIPFGEDYDRESEKLLWQYVKHKYDSDFFFVSRFPSKVKPFYVMKVDDEPQWARSVDLIYKGVELSSGGQREHRYNKLAENIREKGMNHLDLEWFTKFFKFGVPPHGGFAVGIERLTQHLLDLRNIREATLFPRDTQRLFP